MKELRGCLYREKTLRRLPEGQAYRKVPQRFLIRDAIHRKVRERRRIQGCSVRRRFRSRNALGNSHRIVRSLECAIRSRFRAGSGESALSARATRRTIPLSGSVSEDVHIAKVMDKQQAWLDFIRARQAVDSEGDSIRHTETKRRYQNVAEIQATAAIGAAAKRFRAACGARGARLYAILRPANYTNG
jgi:hypothetical protein